MGIAPPVHVLKQWALWQDPSNGPFGFFRRGPDSDMALGSHGFVWHLLTFYISNLTSEASLWHSMLCPFTASVARGPSYIFLHLLTENHLPTGTFMNFDELSSFCQPRLKTTLRYSAKSVRLGGYDLIQIGPIRWLHHDAGTHNWTRRATQCQCHCFLWSLWILSQRPWLRHGSWLTRICLTFIDILHRKLPSDIPCFVPSWRAWLEAYFLHLLTENHLPTGTFMNFDELSSFCQPRLKTTLRYSAKSVRLGGYDLIQIGPIGWLHHDAGTQRNWTRRATQCQCHCFLWSLWILSQRPWLRHGSWLTRVCLTFIDILHLKFDIGSFPLTFHALSLHGKRGSRPTSYIFLHLLTTENHLPTGTFMNFDELSSFCQPRLKTTLRYSAKSVKLGGYDLIQIGPIRWLHQGHNTTGHAGQLSASVIAFFGPFGFFRRGPDSDMALDSHGFVWHLLTFYIGSFPLTFHALSLHGERGSRPTSYIFLLKIIFQLRTGTFISWTLTNFHHFVNLVWKRHCATRQSQLDSAAMT